MPLPPQKSSIEGRRLRGVALTPQIINPAPLAVNATLRTSFNRALARGNGCVSEMSDRPGHFVFALRRCAGSPETLDLGLSYVFETLLSFLGTQPVVGQSGSYEYGGGAADDPTKDSAGRLVRFSERGVVNEMWSRVDDAASPSEVDSCAIDAASPSEVDSCANTGGACAVQ